ncbi:hypothetical protein [Phreatobacter sp.]|uniref:hypothetical protein n=1 Tax=Phreatobacter sp. TaxID=1966341 RepID=UPI003F72327C
MHAQRDIRKSALTLLAAAVLSTAAGFASQVHASPLAAAAHLAAPSIRTIAEYGTHEGAGTDAHRLTRPANRFHGFVGQPGPKAGAAVAR